MTPSTSIPLARPSQSGWSAISAVHCVRARTKTRSKNSSSGVTRSSERSTAVMCGARIEAADLTPPSSRTVGLSNEPGPPHGGPGSNQASGLTASDGLYVDGLRALVAGLLFVGHLRALLK